MICHCAKHNNTECGVLLTTMLNVVMLDVIMLSVVMLNVVAPQERPMVHFFSCSLGF